MSLYVNSQDAGGRETDRHASAVVPVYKALAEVTKDLPPSRGGRPVHVSTITRWIVAGVRLRDGTRLHLRGTRLPGRWVIEPEAVAGFIATLTADRSAEPTTGGPLGPITLDTRSAAVRSAGSRRKDKERARRELDSLGVR